MNGLKSALAAVIAIAIAGCSGSDQPSNPAPVQTGDMRVSRVLNEFDDGGSLRIDSEYNNSGLLAKQTFFRDNIATQTSVFKYSPTTGRLDVREDDVDSNGVVDNVYRYEYSSSGQMSSRRDDKGNDGTFDGTRVYEFDAAGLATGYRSSTLNPDGSVNAEVGIVSFEYLSDRVTAVNFDDVPLGDNDVRQDIAYNADGSVSKVTITSQQAGRSGEANYTYASAGCNGNWTNSSFAYFCVNSTP